MGRGRARERGIQLFCFGCVELKSAVAVLTQEAVPKSGQKFKCLVKPISWSTHIYSLHFTSLHFISIRLIFVSFFDNLVGNFNVRLFDWRCHSCYFLFLSIFSVFIHWVLGHIFLFLLLLLLFVLKQI